MWTIDKTLFWIFEKYFTAELLSVFSSLPRLLFWCFRVLFVNFGFRIPDFLYALKTSATEIYLTPNNVSNWPKISQERYLSRQRNFSKEFFFFINRWFLIHVINWGACAHKPAPAKFWDSQHLLDGVCSCMRIYLYTIDQTYLLLLFYYIEKDRIQISLT